MKNKPLPKSFSFRTSTKGIEIINDIFKSLTVSVLSLKLFSFINILIIATVAILPNSDGCKVNSPRLYQLRAPFTIGAKLFGTKNIPTKRTSANK